MAALRAWNRAQEFGDTAAQMGAAMILRELFAEGQNAEETPQQAVERLLDFPSHRLAVYGSLAPGKQNHHMMSGMAGTWRKALLRGTLHHAGWGAGQGFPGFVWDGCDTPIAAQVFSSRDLPQHWQRLDDFEGEEYRRVLVPVEILPQQAKVGLAGEAEAEGGEIEVCNVYELAELLTTDSR